jgi:hypothetical protein
MTTVLRHHLSSVAGCGRGRRVRKSPRDRAGAPTPEFGLWVQLRVVELGADAD